MLEPWSWYNQAFFPISYRQFKKEIEANVIGSRVVRLDPSTTILLNETSIEEAAPLEWIKRTTDQIVDYEFNPKFSPPPTSEIAKHLGELSSHEAQIVYDYCKNGILEKFKSLDTSTEKYFDKPRTWRLSVFNHFGVPEHFFYYLNQNAIEIKDANSLPEWTTEIPSSKLHAALELGESLSSMYMRINDFVFNSQVESEIASADIIEDPLVRCLFTGVIGAYQKAQLKRLAATHESSEG